MQAVEATKVLLGVGKPLAGRLVIYDALQSSFRQLDIRRDESCKLCGRDPEIAELMEYELQYDG